MSDRIAVMHGGRYEQLGDPESLYERPATRFVAGFLGVSNLLAGTLDGAAGGYAVCRLNDGAAVRLPGALVNGHQRIELGVRPEKIRMDTTDAPTTNGHNELVGTVRDASYLGVSTQYTVEIADGSRVTVYEQNVERTVHGSLHRPGEQVRLTWSPDHTFAVPAEGPTADPEAGGVG